MKMKHLTWILIFFVAQQAFGQDSNDKPYRARIFLDDYQASSRFKQLPNGAIDPAWESMFKDCFAAENVIFDIPGKQTHRKRPYFLKFVTMNRYIDLVREIYDQNPDLKEIQYEFVVLGSAVSESDSGNITFEVEKRFGNTAWSFADNQRYLYEIQFIDDEPKIIAVRLSETDFIRNKVDLIFDQATKNTHDLSKALFVRLKIDYDEDVYDKTISAQTDSSGRISLGQIGTRARIIVLEIHGLNDERFTLPSEWQSTGKRVSSQPAGGFKIDTRPYRWNGWTLTGKLSAGAVTQSPINTANFSPSTTFDSNPGFIIGGGFTITRFFNPESWRRQKNNWIYGLGTGVSFQYVKYRTVSSLIEQNPYAANDRAGDICSILIMGSNYEETLGTALIKIPLYAELRKKVKNRFLGFKSFSLQAGVNLMIPFLSRFRYDGIFSRHGRYPQFNDQIITDDAFYNYYTEQYREEDDAVDYKNFMTEGVVRLNGFIPLSNQIPNHSIVIGLEISTPLSASTSRNTAAYQMSSGDDEYTSTAFAREKLYKYYFGISLGLNFINYFPD